MNQELEVAVQARQEMNIFEWIIDTRSMTAIDYKIEEVINTGMSAPDFLTLSAIYEANTLDERWALAHARRGRYAEAKKLRTWKTLTKEDRLFA